MDGEWVTAIEHPDGLPKQIAIHASRITLLTPDQAPGVDLARFIHYSTDTEPGSSGSPVFNDQWQVVAIHHRAVVAPGGAGQVIANEGVRISAIYRWLESKRLSDPDAGRALDALARGLGFTPLVTATARGDELLEQRSPLPAAHWQVPGLGYDPDFLSVPLPLAPMVQPLAENGLLAPLLDGSGHQLDYWHYSAFIHAKRRFAALTAVNIDGNKLRKIVRKDTWRRDARLADEFQPDDDFYVKTRAEEKVYFSRGHLVRLLDPCWGEDDAEALRGMEDSFHFTNAAPQVQTYNDVDWGNLEDYVLDKAQTSDRKISVFSGPIFRPDDPFYGKNRPGGPWRIPLSFWKIAVLQKTATEIAAAAFIVGQVKYVRALYEARVFSGLRPYTVEEMRERHIQTTIETVERETGLDFSALRAFDTQGSLESTRQTRFLTQLSDLKI